MSIEKYIPDKTLQNFKSTNNFEEWSGDVEDKSLFQVWSAIRGRNSILFY